jgi:Restriction endonuclease AspBHI N-terminal/Restriction endonuclease
MPPASAPSSPQRALLLEEVLWKPRENVLGDEWNGFRNFWRMTDSPDGTHIRQTAGINPLAQPRGTSRRPAIAIFLTPAGQKGRLPWLDEVDLDTGFIRYFGDNQPELHGPAESAPGNKALLNEIELYASDEINKRRAAAPLLFFRNLGSREGEPLTEFLGFGLIKAAHRITQLHKRKAFTNYAYDCILFNGHEDPDGEETLRLEWIDARRSGAAADEETLSLAPGSWRHWVQHGVASVDSPQVRRFVHRSPIWAYDDQMPPRDSSLGRTLQEIYDHYEVDYKHGFQALAALVSSRILGEPGLTYFRGWVTPIGPDGGVDFVQRMDLGTGLARTQLVILGQAKCKKPWTRGSGVSAEELARVVARLRRGWIGSYVTTSFFTDAAQREQAVDKYPLTLISGQRVAEASEELRDELGFPKLQQFLGWVDNEYVEMVARSRPDPEDILRDFPGRDPILPNRGEQQSAH